MAFWIKGNELVADEPLGADTLSRLAQLATRRPLNVNGVLMRAQDFARLADEARIGGHPVWVGAPTASDLPAHRRKKLDRARAAVVSHSETAEPSDTASRADSESIRHVVRTHEQKVAEHATRRLSTLNCVTEPDEVARQFRAFLKLEEARLRIAHALGAGGLWVSRARSIVLDALVKQAFRIAVEPFATDAGKDRRGGLSVVAIGGYGRRELAPFSDLDLLLLHPNQRPAEMRDVVTHLLQLLWDAGLTISQRQHNAVECVQAARHDPHLMTALFHARFVTGDEKYFARFARAFERDRENNSRAFVAAVWREQALRRGQFGAVACVQEPHVRESAGGLRDLHTAMWLACASFGCRTLEEARERGLVTYGQAARATAAHDFLLRVRHEAHWLSGRKTDRLTLDLQPALAARFGYEDDTHLRRASERFMRDYYRRALELQRLDDSLFVRAAERESPPARWFKHQSRAPADFAFSIGDGELRLDGGAPLFAADAAFYFSAFSLAQSAGVPFSPALRDATGQAVANINAEFRASAGIAREFLELIRRRGATGCALRAMHETGFLCRYLPEFNRIHLLIQHDLYHQYTVDEHTLRAAESLDHLAGGAGQTEVERFLSGVFKKIADPALLYLAVLLHDIGKGYGSGHIERGAKTAACVCTRLGLDAASTAKVVALVEQHTLMADVSQRRDLNEPHIIKSFARRVGSAEMLDMLLLLTYADLSSVGAGVWSDWKGALLMELYTGARAELVGHNGHNFEADEQAQRRTEILSELAGRLAGASILCQWSERQGAATGLLFAARDRRGLFADVAGALAAQGIEILSADLHTRSDGIATDSLVLREAATGETVPVHRRAAIESAIKSAVEGTADVAALVERWRTRHAPRRRHARARATTQATTRVICDNETSETATLVEVRAADEPGLAYKIARTLTALALDIARARIATEMADALDVFYVTNGDGLKLCAAEIFALEETMLEAIGNGSRATHAEAVTALEGRLGKIGQATLQAHNFSE